MRELVRKISGARSETVNPKFHDEFVALCALYYSGEISEEEWALLQIHMAYCDDCHERFLQYQQLTSDVIPVLAGAAASEPNNARRESSRSFEDAERSLMRHLDSVSAEKHEPTKRRPSWRLPFALITACALIVAFLFGLHFARTRSQVAGQTRPPTPVHEANHEEAAGPNKVEKLAIARFQGQIETLQRQLAFAESQANQAGKAKADIEKQFEVEQAARKQLSHEKETLSLQLIDVRTELDSKRNELASTSTDATQQTARTSALDAKVRELKDALDERDLALSDKDRILALDKDFLAHDRDIRDVIGARNLYIADIFDTTESGKSAKQFGRIFYTRDRSLIFYGFDLDSQAGHKQDVSFQVWGSGSDRPVPVSLGLFYQDDTHKRWVLRCNDSKMVARLDTVFVTVEPLGGSTKPTGKQLLRAYLQIRPNHP